VTVCVHCTDRERDRERERARARARERETERTRERERERETEGSAAPACQHTPLSTAEAPDATAQRYPSAGPDTRPDALGGLRQTDDKGNTTGYIVTGIHACIWWRC